MTTKRVLWTIGVGFSGFLLGDFGGGGEGSMLGLLWGMSIGFGFGSIFDQQSPTRRALYYWIATLGIAGPPFGLVIGAGFQPYATEAHEIMHGVIGALVGALIGFVIGSVQLMYSRRKSDTSNSGVS